MADERKSSKGYANFVNMRRMLEPPLVKLTRAGTIVMRAAALGLGQVAVEVR